VRFNGLAFSCRERAATDCQKANDLAREAVGCMGVLACLAAGDRQWLAPMPGVCYPAHQECTIECDGSSGKLRCVLKEAGGNMRDINWSCCARCSNLMPATSSISPTDAAGLLMLDMSALDQEHLGTVLLDTKIRVQHRAPIINDRRSAF
jgi:hypothetical protein